MGIILTKINHMRMQLFQKKRKLSRGPEVLDHDFLVFHHPKGDWLDRVLKCSSYSPIRRGGERTNDQGGNVGSCLQCWLCYSPLNVYPYINFSVDIIFFRIDCNISIKNRDFHQKPVHATPEMTS
jgi:hypothetical protein